MIGSLGTGLCEGFTNPLNHLSILHITLHGRAEVECTYSGGSDDRGEEEFRGLDDPVTCKLWYTLGYTRILFENELEVEICITDIYFHLPLLLSWWLAHIDLCFNPEKLLCCFFFFFSKRRMGNR